ncbi:MAG: hypothetical protein ACFFD4_12500 [Candidatus Odinarchaeota archaeon]
MKKLLIINNGANRYNGDSLEPLRRDLLEFRLSYVSFSRSIPLLLGYRDLLSETVFTNQHAGNRLFDILSGEKME